MTRRLAVDEAVWPLLVEPQHPVPDRLQRNIADLRRRAPRSAVADRRQRQEPARLPGVPRPARKPPQRLAVKIIPQNNRSPTHRDPQSFERRNQRSAAKGIHHESASAKIGIRLTLSRVSALGQGVAASTVRAARSATSSLERPRPGFSQVCVQLSMPKNSIALARSSAVSVRGAARARMSST